MPEWDEIEELVVRGDHAAALELLARKTHDLRKVASSICRDWTMAEVVVQEFLLDCLARDILATYDPARARLRTWLSRMVVNKTIAKIREQNRDDRRTVSISDDESREPAARQEDSAIDDDNPTEPPAPSDDSETVDYELSEDIRYMFACHPLLEGNEARALILTATLWTTAKIAADLRIRAATVRGYRRKWRRTIRGLRQAVENQPQKYRAMALKVATFLVRTREVKFSRGPIERRLRILVRKLESIGPPCSDAVRLWLSGHDTATVCVKMTMARAHVEKCLTEAREKYPELDDFREQE